MKNIARQPKGPSYLKKWEQFQIEWGLFEDIKFIIVITNFIKSSPRYLVNTNQYAP